MGPNESLEYFQSGAKGECLRGISNLLCPWPTTLYPLNVFWAKGLSIDHDGNEFVCRTVASTQELHHPLNERTPLFSCEVCRNIILPEDGVVVYCFNYSDNVHPEDQSKWHDTFLRVCFIHFVIHGVDKKRKLFYPKRQYSGRSNVKRGLYDNNS